MEPDTLVGVEQVIVLEDYLGYIAVEQQGRGSGPRVVDRVVAVEVGEETEWACMLLRRAKLVRAEDKTAFGRSTDVAFEVVAEVTVRLETKHP